MTAASPLLWLADSFASVWWSLGLGLLSVVLAALEYGWENLSRTRLADSGGGPASKERLERLLAEADRAENALIVLRVAAQMGLVVVLVLLAEQHVPGWWPEAGPATPLLIAGAFAFVWITFFCRVLPGELSVKQLEAAVRRTMPVVVIFGRLLSPPLELYRRLVRVATGASPKREAELYADEILATVEEGEREGHLGEHQADMIEHVLALQTMEVRKLMTPRTDVDVIDASASVGEACEQALRTGRSRYPVVEDGDVDRVVGVVHVKDLLKLPKEASVRAVMRKPWFVPESKITQELLSEMSKQRTHLAVVLDEYGGTAGIATIEDVLEEIVGEIEDEFDTDEEVAAIRVLDDRHVIAPGTMRVDEVNAELSVSIPESDDWDTLGGYVFCTLGRLPNVGDVLKHGKLLLTVKRVVDRRVDQVEIEILQPVG